MSHVSLGPDRIPQDAQTLQALRLACDHQGAVFCENVTSYRWYGTWVADYHQSDAAYKHGIEPKDYGKCKHMIRLPYSAEQEAEYAKHPERRPYEIGLVEMPDGTLAPICDHYANPTILEKFGGKAFPKLSSLVSQYRIVLQTAQQKGYSVKKIEQLGNDKIKIVIGVKQIVKM